MRIIEIEKLENCFDGDFVARYRFDTEWTKEAIHALKELGQLQYYGSFPRPMFQLNCHDGSFVKGVQGTNECRVIYARNGSDVTRKQFATCFADKLKRGGNELNGKKTHRHL